MKVQFIINPCSGRNRRSPWLRAAITDFTRTHLAEASVALTEAPGHATELARDAVARGCELVVAVGGDGTMNEVAQAVLHSPAALALVPCGSGNGLARHLGLPRRLSAALELIRGADRRVVTIDTGTVNGRPFFNAMGLGFDAEVSRRFNTLTRRGLPAYVRAAAGLVRRVATERCTIVSGERRLMLRTLLIAVANSDQYGNNARIAPGARLDDGLLDLVAVRPLGLLSLATLVPSLFLGTFDRRKQVARLRGAGFDIYREAPGLVHTDGETFAAGQTLSVRVNPRSLRILVPESCRYATAPVAPSTRAFALQFP